MSLRRILIVDDEADIRTTVKFALTKAGYEVKEAENGEEAIKEIQSGDNPIRIDAIVCDMQMPKVDGKEAIAYFRQQCPSVPVIVLTGQPNVKDANTLFKEGIVEYLMKPVQPEELIKAVEKAAQSHDFFQDQFTT